MSIANSHRRLLRRKNKSAKHRKIKWTKETELRFARKEEKRIANDGISYTKAEFQEYYEDSWQLWWDAASPDKQDESLTESEGQVRFHLVPENNWHGVVNAMGCGANNTMNWWGHAPVPYTPTPCWLLPVKDNVSVAVANLQGELREAGWKVLTCEPETVATLCNKSSFRDLAEKLGKLHLLPVHWSSPEEASYPCILKAAIGDYGKGTHIVNSMEEVREIAGEDLGSQWVLQELISGALECSTSLLVVGGEILDVICTEYEYETVAYVWPNVAEIERTSSNEVPVEHLAAMSAFLRGYSGICNFNYKIYWDIRNFSFGGQMKIFEVNPRVGGDLGCDVPRELAWELFETLDQLSRWETEGRFWHQMPPSLLNRMITFNTAIADYERGYRWQRS